MSFIALLFVLLLNFAYTPANAQNCGGRSENNCYSRYFECRWTGTACIAGAATTCEELMRNTQICSQVSQQCTIQTYNNNMCATRCQFITGTECVGSQPIRRDCRYNYATSQCYESTANIDGCSNAVSITQCNTAQCYADPFVSNCFTSLDQMNQVFPCSFWSNYNTPNTACAYHGCVLLGTQTCVSSVGTGNTG